MRPESTEAQSRGCQLPSNSCQVRRARLSTTRRWLGLANSLITRRLRPYIGDRLEHLPDSGPTRPAPSRKDHSRAQYRFAQSQPNEIQCRQVTIYNRHGHSDNFCTSCGRI
jgi:hypothetical protein